MLKALTVLSLFLTLGPIAVFLLFLVTGFQLTEHWDLPLFVMSWGFLVGTPAIAGSATLIARKHGRKILYRVNLGVLMVWAFAFIGSLFIHS